MSEINPNLEVEKMRIEVAMRCFDKLIPSLMRRIALYANIPAELFAAACGDAADENRG
jgi:hypothetical protein